MRGDGSKKFFVVKINVFFLTIPAEYASILMHKMFPGIVDLFGSKCPLELHRSLRWIGNDVSPNTKTNQGVVLEVDHESIPSVCRLLGMVLEGVVRR